MQLGAMELTAAQCGDDRTAATCHEAAALLLEDKSAVDAATAVRVAEQQRKADQARRKREERDRKSRHVTGRHATDRDSLEVSPDPFLNPEDNNDDTAREVSAWTGLLRDRVGELWPDIEGFLGRRLVATWDAWIKEMLSILTGGQATKEDLAQVCRDDAALERPIGSPKGLRTFVASAARDRITPPSTGARPRAGGVGQRTYDNGRRALEGLP